MDTGVRPRRCILAWAGAVTRWPEFLRYKYQIMKRPKQDIEPHIAFMMGFAKKLHAGGELVGAEGLAPPSQAKRVRAAVGSIFCSPRAISDVSWATVYDIEHACDTA